MIKVVLIDDHALIRDGLRRAIDRAEGLTVVGEAASVAEGLSVVNHFSPEVVVIDVRLPDGDGVELCRELRDLDPARGLVILTMYGGDQQLLSAQNAGASAFVAKSAPARDVIAAIRHAAESPDKYMADGLAAALSRSRDSGTPKLTSREREVLDLLAEGLGVAAISRRLFISESTTKTHVAKIYGKLGATNRAQALMTAIRMGLIRDSGH